MSRPIVVTVCMARSALAFGDIGLAGRFEFVTEFRFAFRHAHIRFDVEFLRADVVVDVVQLIVHDEQSVAAGVAAVADKYPLGATSRDINFRAPSPRRFPAQPVCSDNRRSSAGPW